MAARRSRVGLTARELAGYVAAQTVGAVAGSVLANLMFALPPVTFSQTQRSAAHLWLGEAVATAGLVLLIFALVRTGRTPLVAPAVGAYIGAAYWFTSSTSFANPAVTTGRAFTDTLAGITPASLPGFVAAQVAGAALGVVAVMALYPSRARPGGGTAQEPAADQLAARSRRGANRPAGVAALTANEESATA
ncbi:MAG TPA: hypothetical protein VFC00_18615 [Micromonosporaceae bacterium]|nr:hypothetical protein [Micromonosporaceae bacterium]